MARYVHLSLNRVALDAPVWFEKLVAEGETDLGRLRERSVRGRFVASAQQ